MGGIVTEFFRVRCGRCMVSNHFDDVVKPCWCGTFVRVALKKAEKNVLHSVLLLIKKIGREDGESFCESQIHETDMSVWKACIFNVFNFH